MEGNLDQYKVLIVDDSDFSRAKISTMLGDEGFNVVGESSSAKEAINFLKDSQVHLAIIDVVMPEVSGIELTEYLSENFPEILVIMISSLAQESIVIDSISAGASDYLQKPFEKEVLITSVEKLLSSIEEV
jgi:two-component system, chemotaxis family, chemotaxis protein CheY